jgi:hypothetical protein
MDAEPELSIGAGRDADGDLPPRRITIPERNRSACDRPSVRPDDHANDVTRG